MEIIRNTIAVLALILDGLAVAHAQDPLPLWDNGAAKHNL